MKILDVTFSEPEANLKFEETLLDSEEQEVLRFWESETYFVVLGYGNKQISEVHTDAGVPVLRRVSGGGTVLQGPGCLNYCLILDMEKRPELSKVDTSNRFIMERNRSALLPLLPEVQIQGITDLAIGNLKFSGNAQRRKRRFILFHGTFLYNFDISMIEKILKPPEKQPEYRQKRSHVDFLTNIELSPQVIKKRLKDAWNSASVI